MNEDNYGWLGNPRGLDQGQRVRGARQVCVVTGGGVCVCRAMRGSSKVLGCAGGRGRLRVSAAGRAPAGRRIGSHHILLRLALRGGAGASRGAAPRVRLVRSARGGRAVCRFCPHPHDG